MSLYVRGSPFAFVDPTGLATLLGNYMRRGSESLRGTNIILGNLAASAVDSKADSVDHPIKNAISNDMTVKAGKQIKGALDSVVDSHNRASAITKNENGSMGDAILNEVAVFTGIQDLAEGMSGVDMASETLLSNTDRAVRTGSGLVQGAGIVVGGTAAFRQGAGVANPVTEGIYQFKEASGKIYVGQSGNIPVRLNAHRKSGKLGEGVKVKRTKVNGGKTARGIAEHKRIQEHTGGVEAKNSDKVSNQRDPIGPKRKHLLEDD